MAHSKCAACGRTWDYSPTKSRCPRCGEVVKSYDVGEYERTHVLSRVKNFLTKPAATAAVTPKEKPVDFSTKGRRRTSITGPTSFVDLGDSENPKSLDPKTLPKIGELIQSLSKTPLFPGLSDYTLAQHHFFVGTLVRVGFNKPEWELAAMLYGCGEVATGRINRMVRDSMGLVLENFLELVHEPMRQHYLGKVTFGTLNDPQLKAVVREADRWCEFRVAETCMPVGMRPADNEVLWGKYPSSIPNTVTIGKSLKIFNHEEANKWMLDRVMLLVKQFREKK